MNGQERGSVRDALVKDFGEICAYCQQPCKLPTGKANPDSNEETIEHFRPRDMFPDEQFNWLNLLYACQRCNHHKDNKWPRRDDWDNELLSAYYPRYIPVSEYVNPNGTDGRRAAQEFFSFDFAAGEIRPAEELDHDLEWAIAYRTIKDIGLNDEDSAIGEYDERNLKFERRKQVSRLMEQFNPEDIGPWLRAVSDAMLPGKPFSAYVSAYIGDLSSRHGQLFRGLDTWTG